MDPDGKKSGLSGHLKFNSYGLFKILSNTGLSSLILDSA